jgi:hypothetical protein
MLQCPFISTTVFKDSDVKLGHIATTNNTYTKVTLELDGWNLQNNAGKEFSPMSLPPYP